MADEQLTVAFYCNAVLKNGRVRFVKNGNGRHVVPNPKSQIRAIDWCNQHARRVGGFVRDDGNKIAVFRKVKNGQ